MTTTIGFIPAIDLLGGKVVRLHQGDRTKPTVYGDDPWRSAAAWRFESAGLLHVVDLDAAFDGPQARQVEVLRKVVEAARQMPVQLGGGLRDAAAIDEAFGIGISRVVLGTVAVEDPSVVRHALEKYGVQRVAVAVDEKDGQVRTRGWVSGSGLDAVEFARQVSAAGVQLFLHSAIARDGTLEGPDLAALRRVADAVAPTGGFVMCAGGISSLDDLKALRAAAIPNVVGAISGRALYERVFTIPQARRVLEGPLK